MTEETYITKKKRKLTGKRLETFNKFWNIFHVGWIKRGRADAADSWLDIPTLTDSIIAEILLGAKAESMRRKRLLDSGRTPIMAQGWITARRWEDDLGQSDIRPPVQKQCSNGVDNMVRAFNILCNVSEEKFHEFCEGVNMPAGDKEAVLYKWQVGFDAKKLAAGTLRGVK